MSTRLETALPPPPEVTPPKRDPVRTFLAVSIAFALLAGMFAAYALGHRPATVAASPSVTVPSVLAPVVTPAVPEACIDRASAVQALNMANHWINRVVSDARLYDFNAAANDMDRAATWLDRAALSASADYTIYNPLSHAATLDHAAADAVRAGNIPEVTRLGSAATRLIRQATMAVNHTSLGSC